MLLGCCQELLIWLLYVRGQPTWLPAAPLIVTLTVYSQQAVAAILDLVLVHSILHLAFSMCVCAEVNYCPRLGQGLCF